MDTPKDDSELTENSRSEPDKIESQLNSPTAEAGLSTSSEPEMSNPTPAPTNTFPSDLEIASSVDVCALCYRS